MGALLLLSLLPMALVFGAFGGDDDEPEQTADEPEGERIEAQPETPVTGTEGDDTIIGTDGDDIVSGAGGDDNIYLGAGNDGFNTDEELDLDALIDKALADDPVGAAEDLAEADFFGADGGAGDDYIDGGAGNDGILGGAGDDTLRGGLGKDLLVDVEGENELYGGYGSDLLMALDASGTDAPDLLDGGAQNDDLLGDDGDTMTGGAGLDNFGIVWAPGDAAVTITDFGTGNIDDENSEELTVQVGTWSQTQTFTLADTEAGAALSIDGAVVTVLNGVTAASAQSYISLQVGTDDTNLIRPTLIGG